MNKRVECTFLVGYMPAVIFCPHPTNQATLKLIFLWHSKVLPRSNSIIIIHIAMLQAWKKFPAIFFLLPRKSFSSGEWKSVKNHIYHREEGHKDRQHCMQIPYIVHIRIRILCWIKICDFKYPLTQVQLAEKLQAKFTYFQNCFCSLNMLLWFAIVNSFGWMGRAHAVLLHVSVTRNFPKGLFSTQL